MIHTRLIEIHRKEELAQKQILVYITTQYMIIYLKNLQTPGLDDDVLLLLRELVKLNQLWLLLEGKLTQKRRSHDL